MNWVADIEAGWSTAEKDDGTVVIRASACGSCPRALVADRRRESRIPPSHWVEEHVLNAGWKLEDIVFDKLIARGWRVLSRQAEFEVDVVAGKLMIRGRGDGVVENVETGEKRAVEIKGAGKSVFPQWSRGPLTYLKAHQGYRAQATAQMRGLGLPLLYCVHYRPGPEETDGDGNVLRMDKADLLTFNVDAEPDDWNQLRVKLVGVEAWYQQMDESLPECVATSTEEHFCHYSWLHDAKPIGNLDDVEELVFAAWELKQQISKIEDEVLRELKVRYGEARDRLLTVLNERKMTKGMVGGIMVSKRRAYTQHKLLKDGMERMKKDLGEDVYRGYLSEVGVPETLMLSVPKSDD